jgi:hypothetical protein
MCCGPEAQLWPNIHEGHINTFSKSMKGNRVSLKLIKNLRHYVLVFWPQVELQSRSFHGELAAFINKKFTSASSKKMCLKRKDVYRQEIESFS